MSSNNNNISPRSMDELDDIELAHNQPSQQRRRAKRCSALCKYAKPVSVAIVVSTFVIALIVIIASSTNGPSYSSSANSKNEGGGYGKPVDGTLGGSEGGYTTDDHNTWDNKDWYELTPAEKLAAETLGKKLFFL